MALGLFGPLGSTPLCGSPLAVVPPFPPGSRGAGGGGYEQRSSSSTRFSVPAELARRYPKRRHLSLPDLLREIELDEQDEEIMLLEG